MDDDPYSVVYGSDALEPHMDIPMYESHPGLNLLHCLRYEGIAGDISIYLPMVQVYLPCMQNVLICWGYMPQNRFDECVEGGESIVVDALAVVEKLRVTHPHHFSTLVRVPATYNRIQYDRYNAIQVKISLSNVKIGLHTVINSIKL